MPQKVVAERVKYMAFCIRGKLGYRHGGRFLLIIGLFIVSTVMLGRYLSLYFIDDTYSCLFIDKYKPVLNHTVNVFLKLAQWGTPPFQTTPEACYLTPKNTRKYLAARSPSIDIFSVVLIGTASVTPSKSRRSKAAFAASIVVAVSMQCQDKTRRVFRSRRNGLQMQTFPGCSSHKS